MNEVYFLKTGHKFIPYRGYFNNRTELKEKIHSIMDKSLKALVKDWEKTKDKKWEKPIKKIISRASILRSIQVFRIPEDKESMRLFPIFRTFKKRKIGF